MKITKTSDSVSFFNKAKEIANVGCDKCPCCGETKNTMEYVVQGILNKGILTGLQKTWITGFFKTKHMKCDCYHCHTCGAEWESEPYEWA